MTPLSERVLAETRAWVDRAVIGLNLCPFARAVQARNQIRYVVSEATTPEELVSVLHAEMQRLAAADPAVIDTTLLIHPLVLGEFLEFNDFLGVADELLEEAGLTGVLQVASFHPQFQFAGTAPDELSNASNRSPYPTLHLLREDSVERAVAAFPEAEAIFEQNIRTLQQLGSEGWNALRAQWEAPRKKP